MVSVVIKILRSEYVFRLRYAQQRRAQQMMKWRDYENRLSNLNNGVKHGKKSDKHIKFGDCITLLEAAARNDIEEGTVIEDTVFLLTLLYVVTPCSTKPIQL